MQSSSLLLLLLILLIILLCLAVLVIWILYDRSTLQRLKARQRLFAEMPDTFKSYLSRNEGRSKKISHLNVEIGQASPSATPSSISPNTPSRLSPSPSPTPSNACIRSAIPTKRPIRLDAFTKYYEENMKDTCLGFSQEFDLLNALCKETLYRQPQIKSAYMKNRFANILPYEHSLVRIRAIPEQAESDYVNANFVSGLHSDHEYIACQAPLRNTLDDFYRMILEQKVAIIVNLLEKENPIYFPVYSEDDDDQIVRELYLHDTKGDDSTIVAGHSELSDHSTSRNYQLKKVKIKLDHLEQREAFAIKKIHFIENDRLIHRVTQFHYNKWVDFGTPDNAKSLVEFVTTVRNFASSQKPADRELPMIVHCLAGVGRTGTFIAVDQLLQTLTSTIGSHSSSNRHSPFSVRKASKLLSFFQSSSTGSSKATIDIYGVVYRLRNWRPQMVQTEQQYAFIYDCVRYILEHKSSLLVPELATTTRKISNGSVSIHLDLPQGGSVREPLIKGSQDSLHTKM